MTTYEEVIAEMKELRTVKARIPKLGKLMNAAQDAQLKRLLQDAVTVMQSLDLAKAPSPRNKGVAVRGKTTPGAIYGATFPPLMKLREYCEARAHAQKPAWQVEAERQGWVSDWKAEATRNGWTPPAP